MYDNLALLVLLGQSQAVFLRLAFFRDGQLAKVEMGGVVAGRILRIFCLLEISFV
jgi:hypothetical protein